MRGAFGMIYIKLLIFLLLVFVGCESYVTTPNQTDIQNRDGCIFVNTTYLQGWDTVKINYWIMQYVDDNDFRSLYGKNGLIITIYIPSIITWSEVNYCK